ncbi:MAG: ABC transporter substrate-binding protein [Ilumatobacter sp.]
MHTSEWRTTRTLIGLVAGLSLVAAACGSDSDDSIPAEESVTTEAETQEPATTEAAMEEDATDEEPITTEAAMEEEAMEEEAMEEEAMEDGGVPERIVSLSPTHTETLFAIGAGDLVVAVDDFSNFPAEALELPNELSGFEPNIEAIASFEPDLVILSGDGAVEQLEDLGIDTWVGLAATSFDDVYAQIEQLGAVTDNVGEAAELVSSMQIRIDELAANAPQTDTPLTYFHELSASLFSTTSDTFIGQQYELLGLVNIAGSSADTDGNQFPQLSAEVVIEADPDLIFLADTKCCAESAATVAARDGWDVLSAVQNGNVIEMDDDIASRWGPRIVDYMEAIAAAVEQASVPA